MLEKLTTKVFWSGAGVEVKFDILPVKLARPRPVGVRVVAHLSTTAAAAAEADARSEGLVAGALVTNENAVAVPSQRLDVQADRTSVAAAHQVPAHLVGRPVQVVDVAHAHGGRVENAAAGLVLAPVRVKVHVTHGLLQPIA